MLQKIDFLPKLTKHGDYRNALPEYEHFSALVDKANKWLSSNPNMRMKNCETLESQIIPETEMVELVTSVSNSFPYGRYHLRYLRIWVDEDQSESPPQELRYLNIMSGSANQTPGPEFPEFESLSSVLESYNDQWRENPLPGRIISIASERQPFSKWPSRTDLDDTLLVDGTIVKSYHVVHTLRIFYVNGSSTVPHLGLKDFAPQILSQPKKPRWDIFSDRRPIFEPIEKLEQEAEGWRRDQQHLRIISMHTIVYRLSTDDRKCLFSKGKSQNIEIRTQRSPVETVEHFTNKHHYLSLLRIVFDKEVASSQPEPIASRCFLPRPLEFKSQANHNLEPQATNISRISHFLSNQGTKLAAVETIQRHMKSPLVQDPCATYWTVSRTSSIKVLTFFRVYLLGEFNESPQANGGHVSI